jgi:hypothetical protein
MNGCGSDGHWLPRLIIDYRVSQNYVNIQIGGSRPANRCANFWLTTVGEPYSSIKPATTPLGSSVNLSPIAYVCLQEKNNPLMLT